MSILKKKLKKEEEGDELEKILNELKNEQEEDRGDAATVTIQIAGLKELVKAVERLADTLKRCGEQQ